MSHQGRVRFSYSAHFEHDPEVTKLYPELESDEFDIECDFYITGDDDGVDYWCEDYVVWHGERKLPEHELEIFLDDHGDNLPEHAYESFCGALGSEPKPGPYRAPDGGLVRVVSCARHVGHIQVMVFFKRLDAWRYRGPRLMTMSTIEWEEAGYKPILPEPKEGEWRMEDAEYVPAGSWMLDPSRDAAWPD